MIKALILALSILTFSGCSVILAATGSHEPDLSNVQIGASRTQIEASLGKPIRFIREWTGDVATYQYFTGDEPSTQRAILYGVLDLVTVFISELFTFQGEVMQGDKHTVVVIYDRQKNAKDIQHYFNEAPLPKFKKELIVIDQKDSAVEKQ